MGSHGPGEEENAMLHTVTACAELVHSGTWRFISVVQWNMLRETMEQNLGQHVSFSLQGKVLPFTGQCTFTIPQPLKSYLRVFIATEAQVDSNTVSTICLMNPFQIQDQENK